MKSHSSLEFAEAVVNDLIDVDIVIQLIHAGISLMVAGPEHVLDQLPAGNWIGGTTPYFMTHEGGKIVSDGQLFVSELSAIGRVTVASFDAASLADISGTAPDRGFALAIMPALSSCHERFALEAPFYPATFLKPVVGWIAGYDLKKGGTPYVYDGRGPYKLADGAVALHVEWDDDRLACPSIVNPFRPDLASDILTFAGEGFVQTHCIIDGHRLELAPYLKAKEIDDGHRPLVGDYGGASINVSIQNVDHDTGAVTFYAPVFKGVDYRIALGLDNYRAAFEAAQPKNEDDIPFWSCNCILNFMLGKLEGQCVGNLAGPVTFGEIAYQLLNQTTVQLHLI
ncbi:hypothetical protein LWE61_20365 [Sphingobium sufflavum]|uniref:DUF6976 family protein n=1 Tax=Sphingobium sufflavum TaxID=1129547 RepID=UPI001F47EDCC|nr:hypothetical protein [Sphingobium sufflavum]MCE7798887.1 hypothetical protein [Sphingobium sufflavum]